MIPKCYDCLFVYLPECLFLKLCNKCERVIVGVVLSEHGSKCDIAIFSHCHTHIVINVNETVETESSITVKYIELCLIVLNCTSIIPVLVTLTIKGMFFI